MINIFYKNSCSVKLKGNVKELRHRSIHKLKCESYHEGGWFNGYFKTLHHKNWLALFCVFLYVFRSSVDIEREKWNKLCNTCGAFWICLQKNLN